MLPQVFLATRLPVRTKPCEQGSFRNEVVNIDVRRVLRRSFDAYLRWVKRSALPELVDVDHEQRRLNLLRITVGLVALVRTVLIVDAARFYFVDPTTGALPTLLVFWSTVELALLGMFTLGICTPLATLGLIGLPRFSVPGVMRV